MQSPETARCPYRKERILTPSSHHTQNSTQNG